MALPGIAALGLIFAVAPASTPGVQGTFAIEGAPFAFQDAVAYRKTDWDGPRIVVLLLEKPCDHAALARTLDVVGLVEAAKEAGSWAALEFTEDGRWTYERHVLRIQGGSSSGSKYDHALAATMKATVQGGSLSGRVRADFGAGSVVDLTLALKVAEPPAASPLPADGGEPGQALRGCSAAFAKRNLADLQRLCSSNLGDIVSSSIRMKAQGMQTDDPWTPVGAGECEVAAVSSLSVGAGVTAGDEARIRASGGWDKERRCAGDVFLRRENGAWRVSASRLAIAEQ
jgi:hypothetical protein